MNLETKNHQIWTTRKHMIKYMKDNHISTEITHLIQKNKKINKNKNCLYERTNKSELYHNPILGWIAVHQSNQIITMVTNYIMNPFITIKKLCYKNRQEHRNEIQCKKSRGVLKESISPLIHKQREGQILEDLQLK